ncbi:MAG: TonB-dependent receptor, partial [Gemmatimonadota bacterium]
MLAGALVVFTLQQAAAQPPADTSKRVRDTTRLSTVEIREREDRGRRYSPTWSSTALKVSAPLRDTPLSVYTVTGAQLREQSTLSLTEALRYVPGVTMGQGEGHRDAPTVRGNASTADFYIDGIRDDAQYFRDLYNAERVEALTGPNALTFGRGGGGGVINRVTKRAGFDRTSDIALEGGAFNHGRGTVDVGGALSQRVAGRLNALYQHSRSFRDAFVNTRVGLSPQTTVALSPVTTARVGAEYFSDERTVDRGLPSLGGRPSIAPRSLVFGNPDSSYAEARVMSGDAVIEHQANDRVSMRSQLRLTRYKKFYQNVYPGSSVDATTSTVKLAAYNSESERSNAFSQNELAVRVPTARFPQTLLVGLELGRQATDNARKTGYFNGASTSLSVPFGAPTVSTPVEFRPSASDANNFVRVQVASLYVQDLLWITPKVQATLGARLDRFDMHYRNNRAPQVLDRRDNMVSPRAGLVFKPIEPVSLYTSLSVSHLPSSGDQFSSLTPTTQTLEPERFTNREVGVKWSILPALSVNAAAYRLMRTNTAAPSAVDPGVYVQTGRQKT